MDFSKLNKFPLLAMAILLLSAFALAAHGDVAFTLPPRPESGWVYDEDRVMSVGQVEYFNSLSAEVERATGVAIAAALMDDIGEIDAHGYARHVAEKWMAAGNGDAEILIFVSFKQRRRSVQILGSAKDYLDEPTASRLQQTLLIPQFQKERFGNGIVQLAYGIAQNVANKKNVALKSRPPEITEDTSLPPLAWAFVIIVFALLLIAGRSNFRKGIHKPRKKIPGFTTGEFGESNTKTRRGLMNKILSIQELQESKWPARIQEATGENLVSAFVHGECLEEGFSALTSPWIVSLILKDNSAKALAALQPMIGEVQKTNIQFRYFFCPAEIVKNLETFPLEFLHIASKNVPLCGVQPLAGFTPNAQALQQECRREIQGISVRLRQSLATEKPGKALHKAIDEYREESIFALEGLYYLQKGKLPENRNELYSLFQGMDKDENFIDVLSAAQF